MVGIFGFVVGTVIGSYLGALVDRYGQRLSANRGRSGCPACQHLLDIGDLIPLVSFLWLRGRCRYCQKGIGWRLFWIEVVCGLGTGFLLATSAFNLSTISYILAFWLGLAIFLIDLCYYQIPDRAVLALVGVAVLLIYDQPEALASGLLGSVLAVGVLGFLTAATQGKGMGLGDVKLAFPLGLLVGWPTILVGLLLAFILGSLVGVSLLLAQKRSWREAVPFGPFLLTGAGLAMLWGNELITWYLKLASF